MAVLEIPTAAVFQPLLARSRYKGAYGGRGSGKSHFFGDLLVERCATEPVSAVCIREVQKSLDQSVKRLIEGKIRQHGLAHLFTVQESRILTAQGGVILFQGMQNHTADSIKSLEGYDIAWVEEAQSLSQRSLDLLRPTIRKPGSEIWFGWNPSQPTDPVDRLLRGDLPPDDAVVVCANWEDNPWLPDVLLAEMKRDRQRDPDKYDHVWGGDYEKKSTARIFSNWTVADCAPATGDKLLYGADWGFSVDPTALIRCWVDMRAKRLFIDHEAWQQHCETFDLPALFDQVPGSRGHRIVADSARPDTISYMRHNGFRHITGAKKGPGSVEDGIEWLKGFDIIVHPRCEHVIDELTRYSFKVNAQTEEITSDILDAHNHCIDALRYATEDLRGHGYEYNIDVLGAL